MIHSFLTRLVSGLAITTILTAHFISFAERKEIYLICAVSYFICLVHILSFGGTYLLEFLGLLALVFCWFCIGAVGLGLLLALILNGTILVFGETRKVLLRMACVANYGMGFLIFIGLGLIIANRSISNFQGVDKIEVSSLYFLVPITLVVCAAYYHVLSNVRRQSRKKYS